MSSLAMSSRLRAYAVRQPQDQQHQSHAPSDAGAFEDALDMAADGGGAAADAGGDLLVALVAQNQLDDALLLPRELEGLGDQVPLALRQREQSVVAGGHDGSPNKKGRR